MQVIIIKNDKIATLKGEFVRLQNMGYYVHNGISHCTPLKCPLKDSNDKGTYHDGSPPTGQGSKCNICCEGHTSF